LTSIKTSGADAGKNEAPRVGIPAAGVRRRVNAQAAGA
jgi:hypothetical protein